MEPIATQMELNYLDSPTLVEIPPFGLSGRVRGGLNRATPLVSGRLWGGLNQATKLEEKATKDILDKAQVVAATCVGAGDPRLAGRYFKVCAIDEATQVGFAPSWGLGFTILGF
jgi:AAA domain